ncbi:MAG: hypothetical protein AABY78_00945 [Nitrospirota bacterium]
MRKGLYIALMLLIGFFIHTITISAEETSIKITKCQYDTKGNNLVVEYEFVKGPKGDHIHFWLDGEKIRIASKSKRFKLEGLKLLKGEHKVELRVNDEDHNEIGFNDTCVVVIK